MLFAFYFLVNLLIPAMKIFNTQFQYSMKYTVLKINSQFFNGNLI